MYYSTNLRRVPPPSWKKKGEICKFQTLISEHCETTYVLVSNFMRSYQANETVAEIFRDRISKTSARCTEVRNAEKIKRSIH